MLNILRRNHRRVLSFHTLNASEFEILASRELQSIADNLDSQIEDIGGDSVELLDGVLTIDLPCPHNGGRTFVINKHFASMQIWYSSPVSPPAYFDPNGERWWSKKLGLTLREKLARDLKKISGVEVIL